MDDNDDLTRQRAMDAAAAVAVAAAAAAQQHQEADNLKTESAGIHALDVGDRKLPENDDNYEDGSMQYVGPDVSTTQDGSTSHVGVSQGTASRPTVHHTKRRKVNTCLPCKRRKVKCDRDKPYCGQCKKHNFPAAECVWSTAVFGPSPAKRRNSDTAGMVAVADAAAAAASAAVGSATISASGSQHWYDLATAPWSSFTPLPVEQNGQVLANRVTGLEASSAALGATGDGRQNQHQWDVKGDGAIMSEAERGMAADALAMIARHDTQAAISTPELSGSQTILFKGKRLLPFSSSSLLSQVLLYQPVRSLRARELAALLPDLASIQSLIADIATLQEHGLDAGINTKLVSNQLDKLDEALKTATGEIDLAFVALLYHLLAFSLEMKDESEASDRISLPETTDGDRSHRRKTASDLWSGAGQALLSYLEYRETPNLNTLMALSLKRCFLDARGRRAVAQNTLATALSLCNALDVLDNSAELTGHSGGSTLQMSFLDTQPPLLLRESAQMLYCSLVAQSSLQDECSLFQTRFDFDTARPAAEHFSRAVFELSKDVEKVKKSRSGLEALAEKWTTHAVLLGDEAIGVASTTEAIVKKFGKAMGYQWTVLQMLAGHQLARLHRRFWQDLSLESAWQLLSHRQWLEEQQPVIFKAEKVSILQQATLEAALLIALRLAEKSAEGLGADKREVLIKTIGYLSSSGTQDNIVQKLLYYCLGQSDGKGDLQEELQGLSSGFDYAKQICSAGGPSGGRAAEDRFWKAVARQGTLLLESYAASS